MTKIDDSVICFYQAGALKMLSVAWPCQSGRVSYRGVKFFEEISLVIKPDFGSDQEIDVGEKACKT